MHLKFTLIKINEKKKYLLFADRLITNKEQFMMELLKDHFELSLSVYDSS